MTSGTVVLDWRLNTTLDWDRALGVVDGFVLAIADVCDVQYRVSQLSMLRRDAQKDGKGQEGRR